MTRTLRSRNGPTTSMSWWRNWIALSPAPPPRTSLMSCALMCVSITSVDDLYFDVFVITFVCSTDGNVICSQDWGAALGYMYENKYPHKVGKMIAVDVGLNVDITWRLVLYQSILAFTYLVTQLLGTTAGKMFLALFTLIMKSFSFLGPLNDDVDLRYYIQRCNPTVHMTYPYFYVYKAILTGNMKKLLSKFPSCPFLYMVMLSWSIELMHVIVLFCFINTSILLLFCSSSCSLNHAAPVHHLSLARSLHSTPLSSVRRA